METHVTPIRIDGQGRGQLEHLGWVVGAGSIQ